MINHPIPPIDIPGYKLLGLIGQGGMAVVYEATQVATNRPVAIKFLKKVDHPDRLNQFLIEAQTIANLEHPHVLTVYDAGQVESQPYLVMRLLAGGAISDRITNGAVDPMQALEWIAAIADALDYAHSNEIVHQDIKPSNLLLDESNYIYLTDFGIAAVSGASVAGGSAPYMSPERARQETDLDGKSDVYALAVTLFEMVTATLPYIGETPLAVKVQHINDPVPSARDRVSELSLAIDDLIQWGMRKNPKERPNAAQFATGARLAVRTPDETVHDKVQVEPIVRDDLEDQVTAVDEAEEPDGQSQTTNRFRTQLIIYGMALLTAMLVAFIVFRVSPFARGAATPTVTRPPLIVDNPIDLATVDPNLIFQNAFDSGQVPASLADQLSLVDGTLEFRVDSERFRLFLPTEAVRELDSAAQVDIFLPEPADQFEVGLICRWQNVDNFTAAMIVVDDTGARLDIWQNRNNQPTTLATQSQADLDGLLQEAAMRLTLSCEGDTIIAKWGDFERITAVDPDPLAGDVALFTRPLLATEHRVRFDNLIVKRSLSD